MAGINKFLTIHNLSGFRKCYEIQPRFLTDTNLIGSEIFVSPKKYLCHQIKVETLENTGSSTVITTEIL